MYYFLRGTMKLLLKKGVKDQVNKIYEQGAKIRARQKKSATIMARILGLFS